ncbi:metal-dependent hydrolase [Haloarcula sp. GH36]|uniref:metal-dependent hydrolase n=1 Tax=Haloarcula montana TaxID=3111776 RepID=UPI002D766B63|nr:metal-dependent hydrolase [Haloarcula sp. GH36]
MFPTAHLALALIPVVAFALVRDRRIPSTSLVGLCAVGSQFPDLIDKPLAHVFHLIPSGRVFMHSLPFAIPLSLLVGWYALETHRLRAGAVFVFAYGTHVLADNWTGLTDGNPELPPDLLWPFVQPVQRPVVPHWAGIGSINLHLWAVFSAVVLSVFGYVVIRDLQEHETVFRRG